MSDALRPETMDALRAIIVDAHRATTPLELLGRGSKRGIGRRVQAAKTVHLDALSGIELYKPHELVLRARAGTPLAEVEAALDEHGQMLPFEPSAYRGLFGDAASPSIGGVLAANVSGPGRVAAGAARDLAIGVELINGQGEAVRAGGRVMKNVTGYDITRLMAGAYGTLGAMTSVTFKVLPRPAAEATLLMRGLNRGLALTVLRQAFATPYEVTAAAYVPASVAARSQVSALRDAEDGAALIRLGGLGPSVRYRADKMAELLMGHAPATLETEVSRELWREVRELTLLPPDAATVWRISLPPASADAYLHALPDGLVAEHLLDWGGGLLWLVTQGAEDGGAAALREALPADGGHATLVKGDGALRDAIPPFQPLAPALHSLHQRLKHAFDPKGILNPGRTHAGL